MQIRAMNFKKFDKGSIRGFFDLGYGGLTVKGCRLMNGNSGLWIAFPQKTVDKDGQTVYYDQVFLARPDYDHVRRQAIADLVAQGHIEQAKQKPRANKTHGKENLNQRYSAGDNDDIPF